MKFCTIKYFPLYSTSSFFYSQIVALMPCDFHVPYGKAILLHLANTVINSFSTCRKLHSCLAVHVHVAHQIVAFSMYIQEGNTPLLNASQEGHDGIVEMLLQAGASVDLQAKVSIDVTLNVGLRENIIE